MKIVVVVSRSRSFQDRPSCTTEELGTQVNLMSLGLVMVLVVQVHLEVHLRKNLLTLTVVIKNCCKKTLFAMI